MVSSRAEPQLESQPDGLFLLRGELSFSTVPGLLNEGRHLLLEASHAKAGVTIDLQKVTRTDSAGLALLVEWTRSARQQNMTINFLNTPAQMLALARLSGLEGVLSLVNPGFLRGNGT